MARPAAPEPVLPMALLGAIRVKRDDPSLARRVLSILLAGKSFVLLTSDPPVAPPSLLGGQPDISAPGAQIVLVRAAPGLDLPGLLAACCRGLGIAERGDRATMHRAIVAKLVKRQRERVATVLLVEDAGALAEGVLDEIHRMFRLDEACLLPAVLLAGPDFVGRLTTPALDRVRESIAAHFRLEADEAAAPQPETPAAGDAGAAGEPGRPGEIATLAHRASELLRQLETRTAGGRARAASPDEQDLAGALHGLHRGPVEAPPRPPTGPAPEARVPPPAPEPASPPPAPLPERAAPAAAEPPARTAIEVRPETEPALRPMPSRPRQPWRGAVAAVGATVYVLASIGLGGGLVLLWRTGQLSPVEWVGKLRATLGGGPAAPGDATDRPAPAAPAAPR